MFRPTTIPKTILGFHQILVFLDIFSLLRADLQVLHRGVHVDNPGVFPLHPEVHGEGDRGLLVAHLQQSSTSRMGIISLLFDSFKTLEIIFFRSETMCIK